MDEMEEKQENKQSLPENAPKTEEAKLEQTAESTVSGSSQSMQSDKTVPGYTNYTGFAPLDSTPSPAAPEVFRQKKGVSPGATAVIALACALITFMATYVVLSVKYQAGSYLNPFGSGENSTLSYAVEKLMLLDGQVRGSYIGEIDDDALADWMIKGYMYGLGDPYAEYYTADEFSALMAENRGEMQGIGISVVIDGDTGLIQIISVLPDSPAEEAGVQVGDLIAYVKTEDGEYGSVAEMGYSKAVSYLQGLAGTNADFIVLRGTESEESVEFSIRRGHLTETTVTGHLYAKDSTVGIVQISSFESITPDQFTETVESLLSQGAQRLIFDVRNNPGGDLDAICAVLDYLLPEGPVVRTIDKAGNEQIVYTSDKEELDVPMAVLVNENTASAAELFSSALQDYEKAPIVGVQTYGKGSMQTVQSFGDGSGFKYTYRYYCPPLSDNFDGVGVIPDVVEELDEALQGKNIYTITDEEDNQLAAAYAQLMAE